jgi:succinate dehydrogenase / fumarate reductase flavoprotein subunit
MPTLEERPYVQEAEKLIKSLLNKKGTSRIHDIRTALQDAMTEHCGIYRDMQSIQQGLQEVQKLKERYEKDLNLDDRGTIFNMELMAALELRSLFTVGEMILASALQRRESRGAHYRSDYQQRDDAQFLKHSLVYLSQDKTGIETNTCAVDLSLQTVDPERFIPQERKY